MCNGRCASYDCQWCDMSVDEQLENFRQPYIDAFNHAENDYLRSHHKANKLHKDIPTIKAQFEPDIPY